MSSKPSDVVRWGETVGGTPTANLTVPSVGHADTGWTLSEAPTSGLFNWLGQRSYKWFQWLDDGDCTFHNLSATGTLGVTGNATVGGTLGVTGNTTVGGTLGVTGATTLSSSLSVAGALTQTGGGATVLSGTLGVTGATTLSSSLSVAGVLTQTGGGATALSGTLGVTGLITANAGVTAGANQHVTVSGTGQYKHAGQILSFTGVSFVAGAGTVGYTTDGGISSTSACVLLASIPLKVGDRITSITVTFDSATGTVDVTDLSVNLAAANGAITSLGSTTVSNISTTTTTPLDLTDTTLAVNESFSVSISINATGCTVRNVNVFYTRP